MNWLATISGCVALVVLAGCRSKTAAPPNQFDYQRQCAAIEERAARIFTNAVLLKPRETVPATNLAFTLAPLLVQEVADSGMGSNSGPATVYYQLGAVQIGEITRSQMTYLWSCSDEKRLPRGVRLTLDSNGLPVIWEVLDDRSGPRVMFVSQLLEKRARATYGAPAAGRRFAVESELASAPDVVVARVNDDGPVAMGPIVHLTAPRGDINAVICRCMPTQIHQLVRTDYYELKPLSAVTNLNLEILETRRCLIDELRLPVNF
ncbi:MAG: hypothetical protein MUF81_03320 [Verrucomicrobia bacterium]|jgi:hypothetical protein|nr:hypothetical protein [Verrucomicrobiota bacterium]